MSGAYKKDVVLKPGSINPNDPALVRGQDTTADVYLHPIAGTGVDVFLRRQRYDVGSVPVAPPAPPTTLVPSVLRGYVDPLDPASYSEGPRVVAPPYTAFVEPPASYMVRVLEGFRDPLDPASYSEGPRLLGPPPSGAVVSILIPGLPLGTQQMMAAAAAAAATPGPGVGAGSGSHILVNTRGGGIDAWAWQNG